MRPFDPFKDIRDAMSSAGDAMAKAVASFSADSALGRSFKLPEIVPLAVQNASNFQEAIREQLEYLQNHLQADEELLVLYCSSVDVIRVRQIFMRSTNLVVIEGIDHEGNESIAMSHMSALQLTCKVVKVAPEKQPVRIGFTVV